MQLPLGKTRRRSAAHIPPRRIEIRPEAQRQRHRRYLRHTHDRRAQISATVGKLADPGLGRQHDRHTRQGPRRNPQRRVFIPNLARLVAQGRRRPRINAELMPAGWGQPIPQNRAQLAGAVDRQGRARGRSIRTAAHQHPAIARPMPRPIAGWRPAACRGGGGEPRTQNFALAGAQRIRRGKGLRRLGCRPLPVQPRGRDRVNRRHPHQLMRRRQRGWVGLMFRRRALGGGKTWFGHGAGNKVRRQSQALTHNERPGLSARQGASRGGGSAKPYSRSRPHRMRRAMRHLARY